MANGGEYGNSSIILNANTKVLQYYSTVTPSEELYSRRELLYTHMEERTNMHAWLIDTVDKSVDGRNKVVALAVHYCIHCKRWLIKREYLFFWKENF